MAKKLYFVLIIALFNWGTACAYAPQIYGHRGAAGLSPENSLPAYRTALRLGVDVIDMDVTMTRDGVVVVNHEPFLNPDLTRTPQGKWIDDKQVFIKDLTFEQLSQYQVGKINPNSEYALKYPFQYPEEHVTIPRLEDVIALGEKISHKKIRYQIELKTNPLQRDWSVDPQELAKAVAKIIRRHGITHRTEIQSFDWRSLLAMQAVAPRVKTSFITDQSWYAKQKELFEDRVTTWHAGYDLDSLDGRSIPILIAQLGGKVWSPNFYDITPDAIAKAHQLGLKVVVWTVDAPDAMLRMLNIGVDGIITNRPDLLRGLFVARNLKVAPSIGNSLSNKMLATFQPAENANNTNNTTQATPAARRADPLKRKKYLKRKEPANQPVSNTRERRYFRIRR